MMIRLQEKVTSKEDGRFSLQAFHTQCRLFYYTRIYHHPVHMYGALPPSSGRISGILYLIYSSGWLMFIAAHTCPCIVVDRACVSFI